MSPDGDAVDFVVGGAGLTAEALAGFCSEWPVRPSADTLLRAVHGSAVAIWARPSGRSQAVGLLTAISDGVLCAQITLLEVLPGWRGRGIGTELLRRCLARLHGLYAVDLTCDAGTAPFYARFGMQAATAMILRDRQALTEPV